MIILILLLINSAFYLPNEIDHTATKFQLNLT